MALSESAVSELLDVLRTGQAVVLIRESVRMCCRSSSRPRRPTWPAPPATNAPPYSERPAAELAEALVDQTPVETGRDSCQAMRTRPRVAR